MTTPYIDNLYVIIAQWLRDEFGPEYAIIVYDDEYGYDKFINIRYSSLLLGWIILNDSILQFSQSVTFCPNVPSIKCFELSDNRCFEQLHSAIVETTGRAIRYIKMRDLTIVGPAYR